MGVEERRDDPAGVAADALQSFHHTIRDWFRAELGEPSEPQARAWPEIARGSNVLIVAPTGAGKTLAAFLKCIDVLISAKTETPSRQWVPGVRVLYVSPLKALNNDIYRNLEVPLRGIQRSAEKSGVPLPEITKAVRTGDTPSSERQRMLRRPPDILITTPESLYLILTSIRAREILRTVRYVIVDEIHAVCGTKRGTHLALSLERLSELTEKDPVRIGLSATIEPAELAAAFLGGYVQAGDDACKPAHGVDGSSVGSAGEPSSVHRDGSSACEERDEVPGRLVPRDVKVVKCSLTKEIDVKVMSPVEDYRDLQGGPLWTAICSEILQMIREHRSTLVFVNNRRAAEIVAAGINSLAGEEIARSHHGSVSKEARLKVESLLKEGQLPCLVATSSLELGIDIGAIDLVVQIEAPTTIAQVVQRIGRSGHRLDAVSKGVIMTKTRGDLLRCAFAEAQMEEGYIEDVRVPEAPLDVLAQQVVACAAVKEYKLLELYGLVRQAYPYRALSLSELKAVLAVLSDPGGAPGEGVTRSSKPRIVRDTINDRIRATPFGRMVAISHSGTIIDRGYYQVCLAGTDVKLGELDEEFVTESRRGEKFALGTSAWRIERIERDRVIVTQAPGGEAKLPFWRGEGPGRPLETGLRLGRFIRTLQEKMESGDYGEWIRSVCHPCERAVENLRSYIEDQIASTGVLPTDRRIVVEHFSDEAGEKRILVHCPLGSGVNAGLGFLLTKVIADHLGCTAEYMHNDDGILIHVFDKDARTMGLFDHISSSDARRLILERLPETPAFGTAFRCCASRALMLTRPGSGSRKRRFPLWIQRLRGAELLSEASARIDHPIVLEAYKECLDNAFDLEGLLYTLRAIEQGRMEVREVASVFPSPFGAELLFKFFGAYMYVSDLPRAEQRGSALISDFSVFGAPSESVEYESIDPRAFEDLRESRLREVIGRVHGLDEVHRALRVLGPVPSAQCRLEEISEIPLSSAVCAEATDMESHSTEWLNSALAELAADARACLLSLSVWSQPRWVATEDIPILCAAAQLHFSDLSIHSGSNRERIRESIETAQDMDQAQATEMLVRRFVSSSLPFSLDDLTAVYPVSPTMAMAVIEAMRDRGELISMQHWEGTPEAKWCRTDLYERLRGLTLRYAKRDMEPKSSETVCRFVFHRHGVVPAQIRRFAAGNTISGDMHAEEDLSGPISGGPISGGPISGGPISGEPVSGEPASGEPGDRSSLFKLEHAIKMVGGVFLPVAWWEDFVLPTRMRSYSSYHLDQLCADGRLRWVGRTNGSTHEIAIFHSDDFFDMFVREPVGDEEDQIGPDAKMVLNAVRASGSPSVADLAKITAFSLHRVWNALEELVWRGLVSSSEFMPVRLMSRAESVRTVLSRPDLLARTGRWSVVASVAGMGARGGSAIQAMAARILRRYGIICKETFEAECSWIPWREAYLYLDKKEMAGEYVRGYFVSGLSGIQFSTKEIVDSLRSYGDERWNRATHDPIWVVLVAADPAVPYRAMFAQCPSGLSWSRTQSSAVVFRDGEATLLATGYGASLYRADGIDDETFNEAVNRLTIAFRQGHLWVGRPAMTVKEVGGRQVEELDVVTAEHMRQMGYELDYAGLTVWRKH